MCISFQPRLTMWNKIENIVVQESTRAFNDFKFFLFSIWEPFRSDNFSNPQKNIYATSF